MAVLTATLADDTPEQAAQAVFANFQQATAQLPGRQIHRRATWAQALKSCLDDERLLSIAARAHPQRLRHLGRAGALIDQAIAEHAMLDHLDATQVAWFHASDSRGYDDAAIKAIRATAPFPPDVPREFTVSFTPRPAP